MELFPAIDLRGGRAVRLTQGDYDRMKVYSGDPLAVAADFYETGARNLHIVDLDGAREGRPVNRDTVAALAKLGFFTEVGGGVRDEARIEDYLSCGAGRVILGTVAVRDFDFVCRMVKKYGEQIAVGVDARDGKVAVSGWEEATAIDGIAFCERCRDVGVKTVIYTDIAKDGGLSGANLPLYQTLRAVEGLDVVASGGVSFESDVAALRDMGLYGAIIGKALYEGRLDLKTCLRLAKGEETA
ncbi:MAG: 1-(5-phosphoribosyl)-5-[(5-phosphoribosylamino)methylideneamino]imidazole-4-carboxamide isomerase [Oscillospiraceae bacterium]|nr:1-(5-phosphoribosyl)-5-[(5-phosphoribosylamino)methylideneamino]imidazole-4-carboxamide isomerase [Oscillospiraceae bacterium]